MRTSILDADADDAMPMPMPMRMRDIRMPGVRQTEDAAMPMRRGRHPRRHGKVPSTVVAGDVAMPDGTCRQRDR